MVKRSIIFFVIVLIAIQIPFIVSVSTSNIADSKLKGQLSKAKVLLGTADVATGLLLPLSTGVPILGAIGVGGFTKNLSGARKGFKDAFAVVKEMKRAMYISIFLMILLVGLLFFFSSATFIRNLSFAFLLGGVLCLIETLLFYYFFDVHFIRTFNYFYGPTKFSIIPFASGVVKSFSKEFVRYMVSSLIIRNIIGTVIALVCGGMLFFAGRLVSKKMSQSLFGIPRV